MFTLKRLVVFAWCADYLYLRFVVGLNLFRYLFNLILDGLKPR